MGRGFMPTATTVPSDSRERTAASVMTVAA
jgi:hypothetical protein